MGHYYESVNGTVEPRHFIPMTTRDGLRPTRITDVRKWWKEGRKVVPSVTTVLNVLGKAALTNWKIDQHLKQAFEASFHKESVEQYISEIKRLTELEMDKAPSAGSDFHKEMESYVKGEMDANNPQWELCSSVFNIINEKTENSIIYCEPEVNFATDKYGGQIDLISDEWLIDYKTKATADKFKPGKMVYDEHIMQLSAYRQAVAPSTRCANIFVCLEDGQVDFHEHTDKQLEKGLAMFSHCLELWYLQNTYDIAL